MKAHIERIEHTPGEAPQWHAMIADELQDVEACLLKAIGSDVPTVFELSKHLVAAGGKRLRPALVILSSHTLTEAVPRERLALIASTVELIHMATLVHDDVIDNSESRRGRVTANAFWGNKVSVLSGDCMLAKAFSFLAQDGDQRIMRVISDMTTKMSESEVLQALCERDIEQWKENYWKIIRHKTAGFLSVCCRCGGILAGAGEETEEALAAFGMELGMAFQLTDDLLDVVGDPEVTGKPVGSDIRDGKFTLPVLLAIENMPEPEQIQVCAMIERDNLAQQDIDSLCDRIVATGAVEMARDHARSYAERAVSRLEALPASSHRDTLASLAVQITNRIR